MLIRDSHEGYIDWDEYERNLGLIAANEPTFKGAVRNGGALLTGLLRCGHCTHKLQVAHSGNSRVGRYLCQGRRAQIEGTTCISFGAGDVDEAVAAAVLRGGPASGSGSCAPRGRGPRKGCVRTHPASGACARGRSVQGGPGAVAVRSGRSPKPQCHRQPVTGHGKSALSSWGSGNVNWPRHVRNFNIRS